jgi:hypothetical protein
METVLVTQATESAHLYGDHDKKLEKLGMTNEGCIRRTPPIRDGWRDSQIYSILGHEWRAC